MFRIPCGGLTCKEETVAPGAEADRWQQVLWLGVGDAGLEAQVSEGWRLFSASRPPSREEW